MLSIGFILPSSHYLHDPFRGDPFTHLHILTVLENHFGNRVELCLPDLRGIQREFALYHIPECDVYLHSIYTLDYREQATIVAMLRRQYPKAIHIAGGPHANEFPEESLRIFDCLIIGEGERTVIQAIEDFSHGQLKNRYQESGIININHYPHPDRKYLPKSTTARRKMLTLRSRAGYDQLIGTNVMFGRGCPYGCSFCAILRAREDVPGIRFREPELIEKEIEYLKYEYGIEGIVLADEIGIPLNRRQAVAELEAIGRTNIVWRGQCRVDGITPELAALASQSGCIALGLGLESVWQPSLDAVNKQISVEGAKETIGCLHENGIEARLYLIIGLPGEPPDIVERTWDFIRETQPDLIHLSLFTVRPGTEVFGHPEKFGIKSVNTDWDKTMHMHGHKSGRPELTFEYMPQTRWGKSLTNDQIIDNYLELLGRLNERQLSSISLNRNTFPFDDLNPQV